jgi:branched-chain amino acid transport system substrate-binding protein
MTRRHLMGYFLLLALLPGLASCDALGASAPRDTIRFGATVSITGPTAKEGEHARDGYLLFVEAVNARGGLSVGGRTYKVALRYYDDESRPERAAELYQKLIAEDEVDFLLGPYGSGPTAAAAEVAEQHQIPLVEGHGSADSIFAHGYRYTFGVMTLASRYLDGILDLALAAQPPLETVAILYADDLFSRAAADGATAYAQQRSLQIVAREQYPADAQDVRAQLGILKTHLQDALLIVRQAKALGLAPRAIGFSVGPSSPEFRRNLRKDADYVFGASQWTPALDYRGDDLWGTPAAFEAAFRARYPDYQSVPYTAAAAAASLVAYQRALEQAGSRERAAVRTALSRLSIETFFGPIAFDERGANRLKPMAIEQLQPDGRQYTVYPRSAAERPAIIAIRP